MKNFKTWTDYHQKVNLIFHAIVAITMIPFVWLYLEIDTGRRGEVMSDPIILILFLLICSSLVLTSFLYKKRQLSEARQKETLRSKLEAYFMVLLITYALLEGAALFVTIAFFLTANYLFVVGYVAILFVFSIYRPKVHKAVQDLGLSNEEKEVLINRTEIG